MWSESARQSRSTGHSTQEDFAMLRRNLLRGVAALSLATGLTPVATFAAPARRRVRPGDAGWPDMAAWASLGKAVGGRLSKIVSPWEAAAKARGKPRHRA